ncbi:unnamed protein product [Bursaphelenchus okinawaensis]|uniref:Tyrosine-protein kinase n=1 Tax=Bursaphelenchus okinawaensis TaxID=465554 RepID=A0A811LLR5_9BILA|nr:unnamed protein product [Bursaphelenchus okinawaensis]CAG9125616.1 unnamed protein product [Bursaphelenchus okinawaensis]
MDFGQQAFSNLNFGGRPALRPRVPIQPPPGAHFGYDPFENPIEALLPIDDSFRQTVHPVDDKGHIIFRPAGQAPQPPPPPPLETQMTVVVEEGGIAPKNAFEPTDDLDPYGKNEPIQLEEHVKHISLKETGINEHEYHHGLLPREDINRMLKDPGDFLLRCTTATNQGQRQTCLSVMGGNGFVEHFMIKNVNGQFYLTDQMGFPNVITLANHYLLKKIPFGSPPVTLNKPVCRQDWEFHPEKITCGKVLGAGAFGQVYHGKLRVRPNENELEVAVKTMKVTLMTKEKIEETMKEARLMRMLRHKNIVRCYGVCADTEPLMLVIEYVPGGSLHAYLKARNINITIDDRVSMAYDAACGLHHIHRHTILHRDIAARNCLYGNKTLKISDFGLSRLATYVKLEPHEKASFRYLAPEVFTTQLFTTAADVWAYGVLLFEIFSNGSEPYPNWTGAQIRAKVSKDGSQLTLPEWAPPFIKEVVAKAFTMNPDNRCKVHDIILLIDSAKHYRKKFQQAKAAKQKKTKGHKDKKDNTSAQKTKEKTKPQKKKQKENNKKSMFKKLK